MTPVLFIPTLRRHERERLQTYLSRARDAKYADRLRAVLWSEGRKSVTQIAELLGKHPSTVQRWLHDYQRFGAQGLRPGHSPGRPRLIDADGEECLRQAVLTHPRDLGHRFSRWTTTTLAAHLFLHLHVRVSPASVRRALHRLQHAYKRPKLSLRHRQSRAAVRRAKAERQAAQKKLGANLAATSSCSKTSVSSISIPA